MFTLLVLYFKESSLPKEQSGQGLQTPLLCICVMYLEDEVEKYREWRKHSWEYIQGASVGRVKKRILKPSFGI